MGNVRLSVDQGGSVVQKDDYYPFGLTFNSWKSTIPANDYLYNEGSEFNNLTRNYETPFRRYDPALGRFNAIDGLSDLFSSWTPYQYAYNNPLSWNDPLGLQNEGSETSTEDIVEDAWNRTPDGTNSSFVVNFNPVGGDEVNRTLTDNGVDIQYSGSYTLQQTNSWGRGYSNQPYYTQGSSWSWKTANKIGHGSEILGSVGLLLGTPEFGLGYWVDTRLYKLLHGQANYHPNFMNLADKHPEYANRFMTGTKTLKTLKYFRVFGRAATGVGIGISATKIATGNGTGWDWADIVVNGIGLATPYIVTAFSLSNPVGWAIGGTVLVYNAFRLYQDFKE